MPAKCTQVLKLVAHVIAGIRNGVFAEVEAIDPINAASHSTMVIAVWTEPHAETLGNPATITIITSDMLLVITRRVVEWRKVDLNTGCLGCIFNEYIRRDLRQAGLDLVTVTV